MIRTLNHWAIKRQARAATVAGWAQQLFSIGGAALTIPVVIGVLGDKQAGLWFSLQGLIAIFTLSDFGFSMAISRQVAHSFKWTKDANFSPPTSDLFHAGVGWDAINALYAASKTIFLRVTVVSIVLFVLTNEFVIPWTNLLPTRSTETNFAWYLLAASFALVFMTRLSQSFLDGLGYMYVGRSISAIYQVLVSLLSVGALRMGFGLIGLAAALVVASLIQFLSMHACLRLVANGQLSSDAKTGRHLVRKLWAVSLPFGLVNTGVYLVGAAQIPLLGAILGAAVVAPIYIAFRIGQAFNSTILQVVLAQLPFFTQQCAQGHWAEARRRMKNTLILGGFFYVSLGLAIYFLSPAAVRLWVGAGHYLSDKVLAIFSTNFIVTGLASLPAQFVLASGRNPFALSTIIHGALTLIGIAVLCPILGLLGAPLASLIAVLLTNFWLNPLEGWRTWRQMPAGLRGSLIPS